MNDLHPDDPRLTSLILGELSADEEASVRRAVDADPAMQSAVEELGHSKRHLEKQLLFPTSTLDRTRRDAVRSAARQAESASKVVPMKVARKSWKNLWIGLTTAAAAALVLLISLGDRPSDAQPAVAKSPPPPPEDLSFEIALLPAQGPPVGADGGALPVQVHPSRLVKAADLRTKAMDQKGELFLKQLAQKVTDLPLPKEGEFPQLHQREELAADTHPSLQLPVQAGVSSLIWITRMIREDQKLPPANAVRIEEMLNRFALRPTGAAAVAKGVSLSVEITSCPWKPSATLMLVSFRGAIDEVREVKARFLATPANVRAYRLIGFSPVSGFDAAPMPTRLPAGTMTSVVVEIDPATPAAGLGSIEWSVDGVSAPAIPLVRDAASEPSDDARFAALVCAYGQWLCHQSGEFIDKEMLTAMARETISSDLSADRIDFLNLIEESLRL